MRKLGQSPMPSWSVLVLFFLESFIAGQPLMSPFQCPLTSSEIFWTGSRFCTATRSQPAPRAQPFLTYDASTPKQQLDFRCQAILKVRLQIHNGIFYGCQPRRSNLNQRTLKPGKEDLRGFLQIHTQQSQQKMVLISFEDIEKTSNFCFMHKGVAQKLSLPHTFEV